LGKDAVVMVTTVLSNVAVTLVLEFRVIVQLAVPEQPPPLHPAKRPLAVDAFKVMLVPAGKLAEQVGSQLMPAGVLDTLPVPAPVCILVTVSVNVPSPPPPEALNVAVTVVFELRVTAQFPVPEQPPPLQPAKSEPEAGVAVKVTTVSDEKDLEQVEPQLIPEGLLVTVPVPVPDLITWSVTVLPRLNPQTGPIVGAVGTPSPPIIGTPSPPKTGPVVGAVGTPSPPQAAAKSSRTMIAEGRYLALLICPPLLLPSLFWCAPCFFPVRAKASPSLRYR
jgi:hypothetical protein